MIPSTKEVEQARELLSRYFRPTRLVSAESLVQLSGARVYLKIESDLPPDTPIVNAVPSPATPRQVAEGREQEAQIALLCGSRWP